MEMVIYGSFPELHVTPLTNYNAYVQKARQVQILRDFTAEEIIEYYNKYFGTKTDDFIIVR